MWTNKQAPITLRPAIHPFVHPSILHHSPQPLTHPYVVALYECAFLGGWVVFGTTSGVALINSKSVLRVLPKGQICVHDSCPVVKWACYGCLYANYEKYFQINQGKRAVRAPMEFTVGERKVGAYHFFIPSFELSTKAAVLIHILFFICCSLIFTCFSSFAILSVHLLYIEEN